MSFPKLLSKIVCITVLLLPSIGMAGTVVNIPADQAVVNCFAANCPSQTIYRGSGTCGQYDAQIYTSGGGSKPANGILNYIAAQHSLKAYDGTIQFSASLQAAATEYWTAQGGLTGSGANFYATNGTITGNVDGNFVAQGLGNLWFGSGAGLGFEIAAPTSAATNYLQVTPGTSTTDPTLSALTNVNIATPLGSVTKFTNNGAIMFEVINQASVSSTTNFLAIYGGAGSPTLTSANLAGTGAVSFNLKAQSTGSIVLLNAGNNLATFTNSALNTGADYFKFQASSTIAPLLVTGVSNTSVGVGTAGLAASATVGFLGMPTCAAAPTGTPAQATGWGFHCYNPATHTLNIYDPVAAGWYHVTLSAGAL